MDKYVREAKERPLTNVNHLSRWSSEPFERERDDIMFSEEDAKWLHYPHSDALVVKVKIGSTNIHRVLVDNGTYNAYKRIGFLDKEMSPSDGHLYRFIGASVEVKGIVQLLVRLGDGPCKS